LNVTTEFNGSVVIQKLRKAFLDDATPRDSEFDNDSTFSEQVAEAILSSNIAGGWLLWQVGLFIRQRGYFPAHER